MPPSTTAPSVTSRLPIRINPSNGADNDAPNADTPPAPEAVDIDSCSTLTELQSALSDLTAEETTINNRLSILLSTQAELSHALSRLDLFRAHLGTHVVAARSLSANILSRAAGSAAHISSAVERLDIEQSRVKSTLEVVEQVAELKTCVLGVSDSMNVSQDWEAAASYLYRASKIPEEIIRGEFAEEIVPSAEVPDTPAVMLHNASESLCALFLREFEKAAKAEDGENVTRFFKLFPLIGRADTGLDVYGKYVCGGVAARARDNLNNAGTSREPGDFFYSTAMARLFEHISFLVDRHSGVVEMHYGKGRMVKVVERLQVEVDRQGGIIIDTFIDERNIERKLTEVKSYPYSFLVQSFLPGNRGGMQRTASPAQAPRKSGDIEEEIDVKVIDLLLAEMGIMIGRWSLYCRFLARSFLPDDADPTAPLEIPTVIQNSLLINKIQDRLISSFTVLTTFFCRRSVEKAFQIDEAPSDLSLSLDVSLPPGPYITSTVEDVMYIVNTLISRVLETQQRGVVISVISTISRVLGSDFIGMIQRKMRDESYPRGSHSGALPPDEKVISFIILINNLDTAADYTQRIIERYIGPDSAHKPNTTSLSTQFPFANHAQEVETALTNLSATFRAKTSELTNDALTTLFNNVIKPRLRPILQDSFRDVDYLLNSSSTASSEISLDTDDSDPDLVKHRFSEAWNTLITPLSRLLSEKSYTRLLSTTANTLSRMLEKRVWAYSGRMSELGAIRLERDVTGIVGVVVRGRYAVREAFVKCTQICLVCNMEEEEVKGLLGDGDGEDEGEAVEWRLTVEERKRARGMVVRS
ncbi:COG4-domain-containing protein [Ascodesmis nigricans]|uniref:Conserved oligomeric Golgi complex subunit 4 n=1 Tax=Ascodesmis nigricans TaxID=341454 RepID=A0A4S2N1L2_9PEZI|nr:COG4-domain-containing protein [Ascodesmis nigricans]